LNTRGSAVVNQIAENGKSKDLVKREQICEIARRCGEKHLRHELHSFSLIDF